MAENKWNSLSSHFVAVQFAFLPLFPVTNSWPILVGWEVGILNRLKNGKNLHVFLLLGNGGRDPNVYMVQRRPVPPHPPCGWVMVPPPPLWLWGCGIVVVVVVVVVVVAVVVVVVIVVVVVVVIVIVIVVVVIVVVIIVVVVVL